MTEISGPARQAGLFGKAIGWLHFLEDGLLVLLLFAMVVLGVLQIVLRNFFDAGLLWADPLLRVMVLWLGLLAALAASRDDRHISIDVLLRISPAGWKPWIRLLTALFTAAVCVLIAFYAARLVIDEYRYAAPAFAGIPIWFLQSIIPFAFALIALRYLLLGGVLLRAGLRGASTQ